jgi:hypothetical protein
VLSEVKAEQAGLFVVYSDIRSESADANSNRKSKKKARIQKDFT